MLCVKQERWKEASSRWLLYALSPLRRNAMPCKQHLVLRAVDNPMLDIKVDMYRYVRVREQHLCETKVFM